MAPQVTDITPVIPVDDLDDAVRFFGGMLGFDVLVQTTDMAYLRLGGGALRLISASGLQVDMPDPAGQQGIYVDVVDIDTLFATLPELPKDQVTPPFDQPYGQREFHVYYGALQVIFGEPIR